ncbi:MAG: PaaI family thioesterase [Nitrospinota bacterium]
MNPRAFQDEFADNHCWGCGGANDHGLRIKSYWSGEESVCTWNPRHYHAAGPPNVLNGGIIATLIDCHCICTAVAAAYRAEGRGIDSEPLIWYVTASLRVSYLRPTPIDRPVTLRARILEAVPRKTVLSCSLSAQGEERALGEVVAVRVPPGWHESA